MNKFAKLTICTILLTVSGSAFAQSGSAALEKVLAGTDAQLAAAMQSAMEGSPAVAVPTPAAARDGGVNIALLDVTEKWTYQGTVMSEYPRIYKLFHSEENSRIIKVFHFNDPKGAERRVEVYFTGGDWMQYGLVYFVTNAGPDRTQVNAYPISELSTPDRENGAVAPQVDPFDNQKLSDFITASFLDAEGNAKPEFKSVASTAVRP